MGRERKAAEERPSNWVKETSSNLFSLRVYKGTDST